MGMLAVASAKGSPGATTTALLLGALWPRPAIVAECDPHGGDVALRMPRADGGVLDPDRGLLSLIAAGRKSLHPELVPQHVQLILGGLEVLVGVRTPEQSAGIAHQWGQLGPLLSALPGYDVIADCGRVAASTPQNVLLSSASDVLFVCDTSASSVAHLRERLLALHAQLRPETATGTRIHVGVVAGDKRMQAVKDVRDALERAQTQVTSVFHIAYDVRGAGFFNGLIEGRPDRRPLVKSGIPVATQLAADTEPFFVPDSSPDEEPSAPTQWPGWQPPTDAGSENGVGPRTDRGRVRGGLRRLRGGDSA